MLAELAESYWLACDAHEMRSDPNKPPRTLEDSQAAIDDPQFDYVQDTSVGYPDWEEFWCETYARGRGNPGSNRTPTKRDDPRPAVEPLRQMVPAIMRWWAEATGRGFSPKFASSAKEDEDGEDFERNNPPARFLIHVAQYLDKRFDAANARGVYDTVKKKQQRKRRRSE